VDADEDLGSDLTEFCNGLVSSGSSRIPDEANEPLQCVPFHGSPQDHRFLLKDTAAIITDLAKTPTIQKVAHPTLLHPDLHKRNILVSQEDATQITSIIDWQATSIEPAFVYAAETPDFAARSLEDTDETPTEEALQKSIETKAAKDRVLCSDTFEVCMKGYVPTLGAARSVDDTLLQPFRHCNTSWRNGIAPGQQHNIELSEKWVELGLPGSCPYRPSEQEVSSHRERYQDFETTQNLKLGLVRTLGTDSDGWVPAEDWDHIKSAHDDMFREWLDFSVSEMTEAKARYLWPFDPPAEKDNGRA